MEHLAVPFLQLADLIRLECVADLARDGAQKVPTLRNIDKRGVANGAKSYMHNGVFKTLDQVVHFYNTRDVLPKCSAVAVPTIPAPMITMVDMVRFLEPVEGRVGWGERRTAENPVSDLLRHHDHRRVGVS